MPLEAHRREQQVERLYAILHDAIVEMCPTGIGAWDPAWEYVDFSDRRLRAVAGAYERGEAEEDALLQAAAAFRHAWRDAVEAFKRYQTERAA